MWTQIDSAIEIAIELASWTVGATLRQEGAKLTIGRTDGRVVKATNGLEYNVSVLYASGWRRVG